MFSHDVTTDTPPTAVRSAVLIVEDEQVSRCAMAALLSACGYETAAVSSAEEALTTFGDDQNPHFDVALVDLDLPGMNGLDLISRLEDLDPSVFPVLITSVNDNRLASLVRQRGVAYLRKPLDFDNLLSLLNQKQAKH